MGPHGVDAAFMGYTAGRPEDSPPVTPSRAGVLLGKYPDLRIVGRANSRSGKWEAWRGGCEVVEARHESFDVFMDYLEARFIRGLTAPEQQL